MYYLDHPAIAKTDSEKQWRADEFKRLRAALALPQKELAELTGLSHNTIRQLPSVKHGRIPTLATIERMRLELELQPHFQLWRRSADIRAHMLSHANL